MNIFVTRPQYKAKTNSNPSGMLQICKLVGVSSPVIYPIVTSKPREHEVQPANILLTEIHSVEYTDL